MSETVAGDKYVVGFMFNPAENEFASVPPLVAPR